MIQHTHDASAGTLTGTVPDADSAADQPLSKADAFDAVVSAMKQARRAAECIMGPKYTGFGPDGVGKPMAQYKAAKATYQAAVQAAISAGWTAEEIDATAPLVPPSARTRSPLTR